MLAKRLLQVRQRLDFPCRRHLRLCLREAAHQPVDVLQLPLDGPANVPNVPVGSGIEPGREGLREILVRMTLRVPVIEVLDEALAVRLGRVVLGISGGRAAEELATHPPAPQLVGVVDGVSGLVTQDLHAGRFVAAFHFEHLSELEFRKAGVQQVERHGEARHPVGTEPLVRNPVVRADQAAALQFRVDLIDPLLQFGAFEAQLEIAHAHVEQLLVGQRRPVRSYRVG